MIDRRALLGFLASCAWWGEARQDAEGVSRDQAPPNKDWVTEVEWLSSSSFRVVCGPRGVRGQHEWPREQQVEVNVRGQGDWLEYTTRYLRVVVDKRTGALRVHDRGGNLLLADVRGPQRRGERVVWERERQASERFWGLGPNAELDGREGTSGPVVTSVPFLVSSMGYGEYFRPPGLYRYAFGERRTIEAPAGATNEFYFYYGPTPKEILEEHATIESPSDGIQSGIFQLTERPPRAAWTLPNPQPDWQGLTDLIRWLLRSSYSAILFPAVDLSIWRSAETEVRRRVYQLAVYLPIVYGALPENDREGAELARERARWIPFLLSYAHEAHERGFPLLRPLGMQYPRDPQAVASRDAFMMGDEILVSPVVGLSRVRSVYLPAGRWTELGTNVRFRGRQVVQAPVSADRIPVFVKNGSIVPLAEMPDARRVTVHYFPDLAGEFFYYEDDGALTQLHAAPAGELLRLEVEPAKERVWEWVVHHVKRPSRVRAGGGEMPPVEAQEDLRPNHWWYDERRGNLHALISPPAGSDHVLYVAF